MRADALPNLRRRYRPKGRDGWRPRERERGCRRAREWVSLRLDGELSELERLLLRRHLGALRGLPRVRRSTSIETTHAPCASAPSERPSRGVDPAPRRGRPHDPLPARALRRPWSRPAAAGSASSPGIGGDGGDSPLPTRAGARPRSPCCRRARAAGDSRSRRSRLPVRPRPGGIGARAAGPVDSAVGRRPRRPPPVHCLEAD